MLLEFDCIDPDESCEKCLEGFEYVGELILCCPYCGNKIKQMISTAPFICDSWSGKVI